MEGKAIGSPRLGRVSPQFHGSGPDTGKDLAREIREYYIPGDFQNWKDHDAFEAAFAKHKLLKDLRASDKPNP